MRRDVLPPGPSVRRTDSGAAPGEGPGSRTPSGRRTALRAAGSRPRRERSDRGGRGHRLPPASNSWCAGERTWCAAPSSRPPSIPWPSAAACCTVSPRTASWPPATGASSWPIPWTGSSPGRCRPSPRSRPTPWAPGPCSRGPDRARHRRPGHQGHRPRRVRPGGQIRDERPLRRGHRKVPRIHGRGSADSPGGVRLLCPAGRPAHPDQLHVRGVRRDRGHLAHGPRGESRKHRPGPAPGHRRPHGVHAAPRGPGAPPALRRRGGPERLRRGPAGRTARPAAPGSRGPRPGRGPGRGPHGAGPDAPTTSRVAGATAGARRPQEENTCVLKA